MNGTLRWAVGVGGWDPPHDELQFLLKLLPPEEQAHSLKFKYKADQIRAIISRLLQYKCIVTTFNIPFSEVVIKRTKGRKPYCANDLSKPQAPNFNFNVSHEGDYVVLAAEPLCICGVDVAAPMQLRPQANRGLDSLFNSFRKQLTDNEWRTVKDQGNDDKEREELFQRHWSLKEAFVKARGDGLGFDLGLAEFSFPDGPWSNEASLSLAGQPDSRWRFSLHKLGGGHWVSVARGPPDAIIDAFGDFTATLQDRALNGERLREALEAPCPPFSMLTVEDLLPVEALEEYSNRF